MNRFLSILILVPLMGQVACTSAQKNDITDNSGYSTPEEEGISSKAILEFV